MSGNGRHPDADGAYDVVSVGFGPAAIAVAAVIGDDSERAPAPTLRARYLERAPSSAWQPNMLLPGTDIQHHFLRDFASPRNPRSRYTFANYLRENDRLFPFTLLGAYVGRLEWSDYVDWTARQFADQVDYSTEVLAVEPVHADGRAVAARIVARDVGTGARSELLARNVLVSIGHQPYVPEPFRPVLGPRVFHSADYLARLGDLASARRVAVVGAGQNAGEILMHLFGALPHVELHSIARSSGFRMYNLGQFSNEVYFPGETDYVYGLDRDRRERLFREVRSTNYASVDPDVSTALYRTSYEDRYFGAHRLRMRKRTEVVAVERNGGGYRLVLREVNQGGADTVDVDAVVLCTGFREPRLPAMLAPFLPHVVVEDGDPVVGRYYRLATRDCDVGLWFNGITEWRHGISNATSFSMMAVKAEHIVRDLEAHERERRSTAVAGTAHTI